MDTALYIKFNTETGRYDEFQVLPKNGKKFTLKELQKYVGGLIDIAPAKDGSLIVLNDEGKLVHRPIINPKATEMYEYGDQDVIVGDVLITPPEFIS